MLKTTPQTQVVTNGPTVQKTAKAVALVIEHYLNGSQGDSLIELSRLVDPAWTEITLVHAMSDILSGLPAQPNEPQLFSKSIREREKKQEEGRAFIHQTLERSQYKIRNEQNCTMLDECAYQIVHYLQDEQQDLLIISANHQPKDSCIRSHFSSLLATNAPCSVLILRKPLTENREKLKVLFAVDSSGASMTAASRLGELVRPENLEVTLATVQSPIYSENAVMAPFVNAEVIDQAMEANARMVFEMVGDVLQTQGIPVHETRKLTGSPATEIGHLAELEHPDLLVVGSHNKKGFLAWLTGSVSGQLLQWSNHNILVVR